MPEWLVDFQLQYGHVIRPIIVGTLVSIVCAVIGCFIVLRRMSFLADAIAHAMLTGVVGGFLLMKIVFGSEANLAAMLTGALLAGIVTVALIGFITRVSRIKQDTAIGIMYTGIFAFGAFVISMEYVAQRIDIDIYHYIMGSVLAVDDSEMWLLGIVTSFVIAVVIMFYRPLQLTSFDPVMAASIGIPVLAVDYLLTACTSLVVVSGVRIAGVILVVALIITPAASAYLLFDRLNRMVIGSAVIGVLGFWLGFLLATLMGVAPGPSVVVVSTSIFLVILFVAPRYGLLADWIRRRSSVPQEVMEDVLGAILRHPQKKVPVSDVLRYVPTRNMTIRRALQLMNRQDLIEDEGSSIVLTKKGRFEAKRLLRAHRLWETYLQRAGTAESELHRKAHQLEHLNDEQTVDYLDDKLGHPLHDPHGSLIPEDVIHLKENVEVLLSMLREGHRATIEKISSRGLGLGLTAGMTVVIGPRINNGQSWTIIKSDGQQLEFDHDQADAVVVKVIDDQ